MKTVKWWPRSKRIPKGWRIAAVQLGSLMGHGGARMAPERLTPYQAAPPHSRTVALSLSLECAVVVPKNPF